MYQRKPRRFKRRSNGRNRRFGIGSDGQIGLRFNSFTNGQSKNRFNTTQSADKLFDKYTTLAKEALSSGDKTLSENYLQHADHFMRIIEDKNKNSIENKIKTADKAAVNDKPQPENLEVNQAEATKLKE